MTSNGQVRHEIHLMRAREKLLEDGYKLIMIGHHHGKVPDMIAVKDGEVFQVEVETGKRTVNQLAAKIDDQYDGTLLFVHGDKSPILCRKENRLPLFK